MLGVLGQRIRQRVAFHHVVVNLLHSASGPGSLVSRFSSQRPRQRHAAGQQARHLPGEVLDMPLRHPAFS